MYKKIQKEDYKKEGFDFEKVEKELLENNSLIYFKEYDEDTNKKTLERFVSYFFNILSEKYASYYVNNTIWPQCDPFCYRSLKDLFLCCKYYYPKCTLNQISTILWNKKKLTSWFCYDIRQRVYFLKRKENIYIIDLTNLDELGFHGLIRNGRLYQESFLDEEDDEW